MLLAAFFSCFMSSMVILFSPCPQLAFQHEEARNRVHCGISSAVDDKVLHTQSAWNGELLELLNDVE